MKKFTFAVLMISMAIGVVSFAAPEPAVVSVGNNWTVEVKFENPQQISLPVGKNGKTQRFWYLILTVTNNTKRDVGFYPRCELMTDTFQIVPAGKSIPSGLIFKKIKKRHQSKYPFLEPLEKTDNKILQGQDNTKDIAVIWSDFDPKAKNVKFFIAGLSNETAVIDHPTKKDTSGKPKKIFLRKTLELSYSIGGDAAFRSAANLTFKNKRWVMR